MSKESDFLDLSDAICPICLHIYVEPVLLPCKHRLCGPCFHSNLELTSLSCPLCKKRVGTWARRNNKKGLVDSVFWERIQKQFPNELSARLQGRDNSDLEAFLTFPHHQFASEGEIREEFIRESERFQEEAESQRRAEEAQSQKFISQLLEEENERKRLQSQENDALSLALAQELTDEEERRKEDAKNEQLSMELIKKLSSPSQGSPNRSSPRRPAGPRQLSLKESLNRASRIT